MIDTLLHFMKGQNANTSNHFEPHCIHDSYQPGWIWAPGCPCCGIPMKACCMLACWLRAALPGDPTPWGKPWGVVGLWTIMGGVPGEPCWKGEEDEPGDFAERLPCCADVGGMGGGGLGCPAIPPGPCGPLGCGAANWPTACCCFCNWPWPIELNTCPACWLPNG